MSAGTIRFQPGPVAVSPAVHAARERPRTNHRSPAFAAALDGVRGDLARLTGAQHVAILVGTGTLANDAIAAQLSRHGGRGLILVAGEFGRRLVSHARGAGLEFDVLERPWERGLTPEDLDAAFTASPAWVWGVHLETSTGAVLDVADLGQRCRSEGAALALDAVSAVGTLPVDYTEVDWVSTVSGKGLASYPGLALVLGRAPFLPPGSAAMPLSLDLSRHRPGQGVPTTVPSELVEALRVALAELRDAPPWERHRRQAKWLRAALGEAGYDILRPAGCLADAVTTLALPPELDGRTLGRGLDALGIQIHYESGYLRERNWVQLCLMGAVQDPDLERAAAALAEARTTKRAAPARG